MFDKGENGLLGQSSKYPGANLNYTAEFIRTGDTGEEVLEKILSLDKKRKIGAGLVVGASIAPIGSVLSTELGIVVTEAGIFGKATIGTGKLYLSYKGFEASANGLVNSAIEIKDAYNRGDVIDGIFYTGTGALSFSGMFGSAAIGASGLTDINAGYQLAKNGNNLYLNNLNINTNNYKAERTPEEILAERSKGLDLNEHPSEYKQLGVKKMSEYRVKIENRTITKEEYNQYVWNQKIDTARKAAVTDFWNLEKDRIIFGMETSRKWNNTQTNDILLGIRPKYDGKPIYGHHGYSVSNYPHLAGKAEIIYPATFNEHLKGWHGGNWKLSLPGKQIFNVKDF